MLLVFLLYASRIMFHFLYVSRIMIHLFLLYASRIMFHQYSITMLLVFFFMYHTSCFILASLRLIDYCHSADTSFRRNVIQKILDYFIQKILDSEGHSEDSTPSCIWSVIEFQSPISISLVSFQRNVVKETWRTGSSIEI